MVPCIGLVSASRRTAPRPLLGGRAPARGLRRRPRRGRAGAEAGRQRDLQPLAADLDHDRRRAPPAPRRSPAARGERRDGVVELGLDPAGVHPERLGGEGLDRARRRGGTAARSPCRRRPTRPARGGPARAPRSRVSPVTITLASSESKLPPMTVPDSMPESTRTPGPAGSRSVVTVPGAGRKPRPGSSPLMRNSMACPRGVGSSVKRSFSPSAMRNCSRTRSMPAVSSVTGCSTCSRVLTSRKRDRAVRRRPGTPPCRRRGSPASRQIALADCVDLARAARR